MTHRWRWLHNTHMFSISFILLYLLHLKIKNYHGYTSQLIGPTVPWPGVLDDDNSPL